MAAGIKFSHMGACELDVKVETGLVKLNQSERNGLWSETAYTVHSWLLGLGQTQRSAGQHPAAGHSQRHGHSHQVLLTAGSARSVDFLFG